MVRGAAIEAEQLLELANQMEADGKEVTAIGLHRAVGRGSLTTIYKFLDTWKSSRPAKAAGSNNEMPEQVKNALAGAWRVAVQEAAKEVEALKEKAQADVEAALGQFRGALEEIEKLEQENAADEEEIDALKKQVGDLQEDKVRLEAENAGNKATADQLQKLVEKLEKDLERQRNEAKEAQDKHDEEKASLTEKLAWISENQKMVKGHADKVESESKVLKSRLESMEKRQKEAEEASKNSSVERDAAIKEAAELKGRSEELQNQNEKLLAKLAQRVEQES